jgi:kynurenine formamidase
MLDYGKKLDDYPLSSFISEGSVIDASGKPPQGDITLEDLKPYEKDINKGEIVVIYTGWGEKRGYESLYLKDWPALTPEAAKWLIEKKINAVGIDTLSFDKFGAKGAPVHNILLPAGVLLIEEMYLPKEILERRKWWFIFLPLSFKGVAGSPCRAVAIEWGE